MTHRKHSGLNAVTTATLALADILLSDKTPSGGTASSTMHPISKEVMLISKLRLHLRSPKSWLVRSNQSSSQAVSELWGSGTRRAMARLQRGWPPAGVGACCIRAHHEQRKIHPQRRPD